MMMKVSSPDHTQRPPMRRRRRSQPLQSKLSSADSAASPYVAMLEGVALQISLDTDGAFVLATTAATLSRSNDSLSSQRRYSFDELRSLKKRLLAVMQHGHLCHAECPWIYSFLKNYFPKKAMLTLSTGKRLAKRRDAIELCLSNVLQFVRNRQNHSCAVVTRDLAQELACALFGYDLKECSVQLLTPVEMSEVTRMSSLSFSSRSSLSSLSSSLSESDDGELLMCQICSTPLHQSYEDTNSGSDEHEDGDSDAQSRSESRLSIASSSSRVRSPARSPAHYTTTLGCGHCFHDECVLSVLNATQRCPTCDHLEIP